jgi:hypothetical protein
MPLARRCRRKPAVGMSRPRGSPVGGSASAPMRWQAWMGRLQCAEAGARAELAGRADPAEGTRRRCRRRHLRPRRKRASVSPRRGVAPDWSRTAAMRSDRSSDRRPHKPVALKEGVERVRSRGPRGSCYRSAQRLPASEASPSWCVSAGPYHAGHSVGRWPAFCESLVELTRRCIREVDSCVERLAVPGRGEDCRGHSSLHTLVSSLA